MKNEIENKITILRNSITDTINIENFEDAKILLDKYKNDIGKDDEWYSMMAITNIAENKLYEAEIMLNEGLKNNSQNIDLLFNLGYVYQLQKKIKLAVEVYEKAYELSDDKDLKKEILRNIDELKYNLEEIDYESTKKVLIGSPIHQEPNILKQFLLSLKKLNKDKIEIHYLFVDDNEIEVSSKLLNEFSKEEKNVIIHKHRQIDSYVCDDYTHRWKENLVWKVAEFKDMIITIASEYGYDYLFLIDSDIVLHPKTLQRLIEVKKDIVSNIFWTSWYEGQPKLPQVWLKDAYTQFHIDRGEQLSQDEILKRHQEFLNQMRHPGTYEIGGLGACTLISSEAIKKGVCFKEIKNVSFWGEDRHFCIRAAALGIPLYVDTYYPSYHIYRMSDLPGVEKYINESKSRDMEITKMQIYKSVENGIENLKTYSYLNRNNQNWIYFFTDQKVNELIGKINENNEVWYTEKLSNIAKVSECNAISIDMTNGTAKVRFKITNDGIKNSISYHEEYQCDALLNKKENNEWVINDFNETKKLPVKNPPIIRIAKPEKNKLTLSMVVKNEADRYLERVLTAHREYIDNAVIIDDGSTDNSIEICQKILKEIPTKIIRNKTSKFSNEILLRKQQWEETLATDPDWILNLDADEIYENTFRSNVRKIINQQEYDVIMFRLYDMWNEEQYREDQYWRAHFTYRPFLIRYQKNFIYSWKETEQHCGRMPENIIKLPWATSELRLKHYGWAREEDRKEKYDRYMKLDPDAKYGWKEQYDSIMDKKPNLVKWIE